LPVLSDLNEQIRLFPARPTVRLLMVVDGSVSFTSSFGIGRVIDLVRANVDGYVRFEVDLARVGTVGSTLMVDTTPGPYTPKFAIPQRIEVRQYPVPGGFIFERRSRPHPLLCGGDLGIIDVLPDHPHEGWVYEDAEIDLGAGYGFGAVSGDEYPSGAATRPAPQAIAWANTLPDPPYNFQKEDSPAKRFAVIGAYDGDRAEVGRVVVDSTWHHWLDMNLDGLAAATPDTEFRKIARYIRNCAVWLAREEQRRQMFARATFWGAFTAIAFEELRARAPIFELGGAGIDVIGRLSSDCLVRDWIDIFVPDRMLEELLPPRVRLPDPPCWSCPPLELLRCEVMGGILREVLPLRDKMQLTLRSRKQGTAMSAETMARVMEQGAERGLAAFQEAVEANRKVLDGMAGLRELAVRTPRQRVSLERAGIGRR
jgi:hypothetical protein